MSEGVDFHLLGSTMHASPSVIPPSALADRPGGAALSSSSSSIFRRPMLSPLLRIAGQIGAGTSAAADRLAREARGPRTEFNSFALV
jgi:hypothetical protein